MNRAVVRPGRSSMRTGLIIIGIGSAIIWFSAAEDYVGMAALIGSIIIIYGLYRFAQPY